MQPCPGAASQSGIGYNQSRSVGVYKPVGGSMRRDDFQKVASQITKEIELSSRMALSRPNPGPDRVFEYGRACGYVQGLEKALALLNGILKEDEERERHDGILRK